MSEYTTQRWAAELWASARRSSFLEVGFQNGLILGPGEWRFIPLPLWRGSIGLRDSLRELAAEKMQDIRRSTALRLEELAQRVRGY